MPTAPADRPRRSAAARALIGFLALMLVATGCAGTAPEPAPALAEPAPPSVTAKQPDVPVPTDDLETSPPVVEGLPVPPDLDAAFTELLDRRSQALVTRDREAFLSVLDQGDAGFMVAQEGYFDNLAQLPLATFDYTVDLASLVRGRGSYSVVVEIAMQLDGFDALPSRTLDRFRFDRVGKRVEQSYRLASVTDRAWEEVHDVHAQPWDTSPIQVRRSGGVLGVFDDTSVAGAGLLLRGLEESVSDVAARVPYPWSPTVVVYALSDTAFIRSLDDVPGDDPDALDAIAFTVPAGPGDPSVVATRIVLNPRIMTRSGLERERLLRHELTHVAVGERDDNAPVWLSEGLAEWVSVQALPERDRQVGIAALQGARVEVASMPDDATFNDDRAEVHYAVSWWVCEYLATTYGDSAPWMVLDAFALPGTPESQTIQALLQLSVTKLAKRGTALLVKTYAPPEPPKSRGPRGEDGPRNKPGGTSRRG